MKLDYVPTITDKPPRILYNGKPTFTKQCKTCECPMPHVKTDKGAKCVICGATEDQDGAGKPDQAA